MVQGIFWDGSRGLLRNSLRKLFVPKGKKVRTRGGVEEEGKGRRWGGRGEKVGKEGWGRVEGREEGSGSTMHVCIAHITDTRTQAYLAL